MIVTLRSRACCYWLEMTLSLFMKQLTFYEISTGRFESRVELVPPDHVGAD